MKALSVSEGRCGGVCRYFLSWRQADEPRCAGSIPSSPVSWSTELCPGFLEPSGHPRSEARESRVQDKTRLPGGRLLGQTSSLPHPSGRALAQLCQASATGSWAGHQEAPHLGLPLYNRGENRSELKETPPQGSLFPTRPQRRQRAVLSATPTPASQDGGRRMGGVRASVPPRRP